MVAGFKRILLIVGVLAASAVQAHPAAEATALTPEQTLARQRLVNAVTKPERKTAECAASRSVLPAQPFARLAISRENLKTALRYFHMRAENRCAAREAADYEVAATIIRRLEGNANNGASPNCTELVTTSLVDEIEKEAEYLSLPT